MFSMRFETNNAAFDDDGLTAETIYCLKAVVSYLEDGLNNGAIWDTNGNKIGRYELEQGNTD